MSRQSVSVSLTIVNGSHRHYIHIFGYVKYYILYTISLCYTVADCLLQNLVNRIQSMK